MRKLRLPAMLICTAFLLVACSSPGDAPAGKWVKFLGTQQKLVEDKKFDTAKFETEGAKLVEELRPHIDPTEHKILLSAEVLAEWTAANTAFEEACNKANNEQALLAFQKLSEQLQLPAGEGETAEEQDN